MDLYVLSDFVGLCWTYLILSLRLNDLESAEGSCAEHTFMLIYAVDLRYWLYLCRGETSTW